MFDSRRYEVRQRFGVRNRYTVYEGDRAEPILASTRKALRLKEDFRFTDPGSGEERFRVRADSVLDVAAAYDVVDSRTDELLGSVRRGVVSLFRHTYELVDPSGEVVAVVREDSRLKAALRRAVTSLVPFSYVVESPDGERLGRVRGALSLRDRYAIELRDEGLDPRLVVIATVVIDAIEGN